MLVMLRSEDGDGDENNKEPLVRFRFGEGDEETTDTSRSKSEAGENTKLSNINESQKDNLILHNFRLLTQMRISFFPTIQCRSI